MKCTIFFVFFIALVINALVSPAQQKTYDLSTPENFIISLNTVGEAPADSNAVPTFYEKKTAAVIMAYDSAVLRAMKSFEDFKVAFSRLYPDKVIRQSETGFEIRRTTYVTDNSTVEFNYSAAIICHQLAAYNKGTFVFLSTRAGQNGVILLSVSRSGKTKDIKIIKEDSVYRMIMDEKALGKMKKMLEFSKEVELLFTQFTGQIEAGEFTPKYYDRLVNKWAGLFKKAEAKLKEPEKEEQGKK